MVQEQRMRGWVVMAVLCTGCAVPTLTRWEKPGATDEDARVALGRCRSMAAEQPLTTKPSGAPKADNPDAQGLGGWGASLEDMGNFRHSINDCMAADGWSRR
jgi:hypothetical protein